MVRKGNCQFNDLGLAEGTVSDEEGPKRMKKSPVQTSGREPWFPDAHRNTT